MPAMKDKSGADIQGLCGQALDWGASQAVAIPVSDIAVDERTSLKCLVPLCSHYKRNLLCPPQVIPPGQFRKILHRYHVAILIRLEITLEESLAASPDYLSVTRKSQLKLHELIHRLESLCLEQGHHFAAGLIGGACPLCDECVGVASRLPCRHPFRARPSMEAMGIDVVATAGKAGMDIAFSRAGGRSWVGLVLVD